MRTANRTTPHLTAIYRALNYPSSSSFIRRALDSPATTAQAAGAVEGTAGLNTGEGAGRRPTCTPHVDHVEFRIRAKSFLYNQVRYRALPCVTLRYRAAT